MICNQKCYIAEIFRNFIPCLFVNRSLFVKNKTKKNTPCQSACIIYTFCCKWESINLHFPVILINVWIQYWLASNVSLLFRINIIKINNSKHNIIISYQLQVLSDISFSARCCTPHISKHISSRDYSCCLSIKTSRFLSQKEGQTTPSRMDVPIKNQSGTILRPIK